MVKGYRISKSGIAVFSASLLILMLVYAAISKLMAFSVFQYTLSQSPLIMDHAALLALLIPAVEILIAALLFSPVSRKAGFGAALVILVLFTIYIGYMLLFAPALPCSCGGVLQSLGWKEHLVFNGIFILIAGYGLRIAQNENPKTLNVLLQ